MAEALQRLRRAATQMAIGHLIATAGALPRPLQHSAVRSLVGLAAGVPMLRRKLAENMRLALGYDVSTETQRAYFDRVGWLLNNSLSAFHHGLAATSLPEGLTYDETVGVLDEAVAERRGVVITCPHWTGHELVAATIGRRHPMAMVVRQVSDANRMARKLKWYDALGVETVLRPDRGSTIKDAVAYLKVLKSGKLLAITPDLLADPGHGVETRIFDRPARLHGGAVTLAIMANAPLIRVFGRWRPDHSVVPVFGRAALKLDCDDRGAAIRAGVQDWCHWFEQTVRAQPQDWLFWLDKRWSRFLRETPRDLGAE